MFKGISLSGLDTVQYLLLPFVKVKVKVKDSNEPLLLAAVAAAYP